MAMVLTACGRKERPTDEVPLEDESTNIPTEFDDKLLGTDDIDTFTALGGDDEIHGFGGNDQIIAGSGNDTIYGGEGDDNINRVMEMIKFTEKVATTLSTYQVATMWKMVVQV